MHDFHLPVWIFAKFSTILVEGETSTFSLYKSGVGCEQMRGLRTIFSCNTPNSPCHIIGGCAVEIIYVWLTSEVYLIWILLYCNICMYVFHYPLNNSTFKTILEDRLIAKQLSRGLAKRNESWPVVSFCIIALFHCKNTQIVRGKINS